MKVVISGKLDKTPELKTVPTKDGGQTNVANFTTFAYDPNAPQATGKSYQKGIPLKCVAWGEDAEYVGTLKSGDVITASTTLRYNEYKKKDGSIDTTPNYVVRKIDKENDIQKQMSQLLTSYEEGQIDTIYNNDMEQPDFNKAGKELAGKDQDLMKPDMNPAKKEVVDHEKEEG